jgi:predicted acylesterase/phospholipase RssA
MLKKNEKLLIYAKNKNGEEFIIPTKQRALILQGGGALGYYEIGVLQSIYNHIFSNAKKEQKGEGEGNKGNHARLKHDSQSDKTGNKVNENNGEPFFDIVAGVSIGAINAVFIVDHVLKNNGKWYESNLKLREFWNNFRAYTYADTNPLFRFMWNGFRFFNSGLATTESARRYWSFYELACSTPPFGGVSPNLCNSSFQFDTKYLSPLNAFLSYNYRPLMNLMEKNIEYPIKTDFEKNQPRLLLLSVDVKDCSTAVTFDSYRSYKSKCDVCGQNLNENKFLAGHIKEHLKEISNRTNRDENMDKETISKRIPTATTKGIDGADDINKDSHTWLSIYGDEENRDRKHVVPYNGIDNDILMASCLFPYSNYHTSLYDLVSKERRTFWDGAFLSNTPLRELLQKHKDFWTSYFEANDVVYDKTGEHERDLYLNQKDGLTPSIPKIPDLEVFIVNLYPALETKDAQVPTDRDKIEDRMNDIRFHDRSKYDEKIAHLITDYVDLTRRLIRLAKDTGKVNPKDIESLLEAKGESTKRDIKEKRDLADLIEDKFRVKVHRIDRQDDEHTINGKASDFTPTTLSKLYEEGEMDADKWFEERYEEWQIEV